MIARVVFAIGRISRSFSPFLTFLFLAFSFLWIWRAFRHGDFGRSLVGFHDFFLFLVPFASFLWMIIPPHYLA